VGKVLLICGSIRHGSTTRSLLAYIKSSSQYSDYEFSIPLDEIPLFHPDQDDSNCDASVTLLREQVAEADGVIVATPEYIHNIPAVLKNALEWLTKTGDLANKKTIAICYTPHEPRGEKAMVSLLYSLKALDAQVLASLMLYHTDIGFDMDGQASLKELPELLKAALSLLPP